MATNHGGRRGGSGRKPKPKAEAVDTRPRWYCLQTEPRLDLLALVQLTAQDFTTFLPNYRPDPDAVLEPVFPGYLFVRFDVGRDPWRRIVSTKGVYRLFSSSAERPLPLPDPVMDDLFKRFGPNGTDCEPAARSGAPLVEVGTVVRIEDGPFTSFSGICTWSTAQRVQLLVEIFGRSSTTEVPRKSITVIASPG